MLIADETSHVRVFFNFFLFHDIILDNINIRVKVFNIKMVRTEPIREARKEATLIHYHSLAYMSYCDNTICNFQDT
jgi:hypothetical protein